MVSLLSIIISICLVEQPFWRFGGDSEREQRAAVAIRSTDPPIMLWISRVFTLPYLEKYYAQTYYVAQMPGTDPHEAFVTNLQAALTEYETVDIFILAHTNHYEEWVDEIDPELRQSIRLVYNAGCRNASSADEWLKVGAKTFLAHPGISESPIFFFFFLRRWTIGDRMDTAVAESNTRMKRVVNWQARLPAGDIDPEEVYQATEAQCFGQCTIKIGQ